MPILITPEEITNLKHWTKNEMPDDTWIPVNDKQKDAFKHLMVEWYGWPVFSLSFNKAMNCVMKIKL
jgi:hypothetical protein